jgi:hypothetical protein
MSRALRAEGRTAYSARVNAEARSAREVAAKMNTMNTVTGGE